MPESISDRKRSHLDLCERSEVEYARKTTLLDEVDLVHDALPDLAVEQVDVSTALVGKRLAAPLVITGMTGGTDEAADLNQQLAQAAEAHGIAFGLGSQRAMQRLPELEYTFAVRRWAPRTLVLANLGQVQAAATPSTEVARLAERIGADAVCIHLNPAQELVQPGGDRDFRGGLDAFARLVRELPVPVIAKETGCGISRSVALRLREVGVRTIDVSGAGGTSWVKVETLRADGDDRALGEELADWGIPTAAAVGGVRGLGLDVIASGGIRSGLDVAKVLALGAHAAGVALPVLRAYRTGGAGAVDDYLRRLIGGLRTVMVLTGCPDLPALRTTRLVLGRRLSDWIRVLTVEEVHD
jgi:isopentenyl-diphosphate delta-isomerase